MDLEWLVGSCFAVVIVFILFMVIYIVLIGHNNNNEIFVKHQPLTWQWLVVWDVEFSIDRWSGTLNLALIGGLGH